MLAHRAAAQRASRRSAGWSTSASIVNAMVALLATGGSTNHLIHWVAVARSAGIVIDWTDFSDLSRGDAAAGARLSERQRRREPVPGRRRPGLRDPRAARRRLPARRRGHGRTPAASRDYARVPERDGGAPAPGARCPRQSGDDERRAPRGASRSATSGGLKLLDRQPRPRGDQGLGGARRPLHVVEAPARRVRQRRRRCSRRSRPAQLERDFVAVVRFQGPRANGMPELHKLTPPLGGAAEARASASRWSPTAA